MTITSRDLGCAWLLELEGEADLAARPDFERALRLRRDAATQLLLVDFSKVTFVNTPIWALLIEYYQWTTRTGGRLALIGLRGRALASFDTVQLGSFLAHFASADDALAAFARRDLPAAPPSERP